MTSRILPFEAVDNFRDYGDYDTAAGRRLRPGRLLRSAHHARATEADLQRLAGLNITAVVDLRRASERARQPSRRCEGFCAAVIETDDMEEGEAPHLRFLRESDLTEASGRAFMLQTYRELAFDERHLDLFSRYFRALGETEGAVLIHCAAGKDRTGLLAALTHHLAGVSDDDLMEDYLLTNVAVRLEERAPEAARQIAEAFGRTPSPGAMTAFLGVEEAYLQAAFDAIADRFGGLDAYLERALGVDAALRQRIEARLSA